MGSCCAEYNPFSPQITINQNPLGQTQDVFKISNGMNSDPLKVIFHNYELKLNKEATKKMAEGKLGIKSFTPQLHIGGNYYSSTEFQVEKIKSIQTILPHQNKQIFTGNAKYVSILAESSDGSLITISQNRLLSQKSKGIIYFKDDYHRIRQQSLVQGHKYLYYDNKQTCPSPDFIQTKYAPGHCQECSNYPQKKYTICQGHSKKDQ